MARSGRAGARREVIRRLKEIKRSMAALQGWWDISGVVYVPPEERTAPDAWHSVRAEGDYPENQRRYWAATISEIDDLTVALEKLRDYCVEQYHLTPKGEK